MMYTIAALVQNGRSFLLRNSAANTSQTQWQYSATREALLYGAQMTSADVQVGAGVSRAGLALLSSADIFVEKEQALGAVFARTLSTCGDVSTALGQAVEGISALADMPYGHALLADGTRIAMLEYGGGQVEHEIVSNGFVVRSEHLPPEGDDRAKENGELRYERMMEFAEGLYAWMPTLDGEDVVERCRAVLRQEPLCSETTSSSVVIEVGDGRVDYFSDRWQTHWL